MAWVIIRMAWAIFRMARHGQFFAWAGVAWANQTWPGTARSNVRMCWPLGIGVKTMRNETNRGKTKQKHKTKQTKPNKMKSDFGACEKRKQKKTIYETIFNLSYTP